MEPAPIEVSAFNWDGGFLSFNPCDSYTKEMYIKFEVGDPLELSLDELRRIKAHYRLAIDKAKTDPSKMAEVWLIQLKAEMRKCSLVIIEKIKQERDETIQTLKHKVMREH